MKSDELTTTVDELAERFDISTAYVAKIARGAGVPAPLPRDRDTRPTSARDQEIVARVVEHGETLRAVAARFEISAERVRQIVDRDSDVALEERLEARRATRQATQVEQVLTLVRDDPERTLTWREIADRVGLPAMHVQRIMGPVEVARRYPVTEPARFEVAPAIVEMRRVWLLEKPRSLTGDYYDERRRPGMVSSQSISARVGSWKKACELAGVPFRAVRTTYERDWSRQDCLNWVGLFLHDTSDVTVRTFARWVQQHQDAPSRHTIVGHTGSWSRALRLAAASIDDGAWSDPTKS